MIKIEAKGLQAIKVGDSDKLKLGEWVLAIGNPFSLTSTVTAGIVSAKARTLNATPGSIDSFIQTDAAINPGNSGGALVNAQGELVGINAMLYSQTGSFSGYGFAIPTAIMNKVVADLANMAPFSALCWAYRVWTLPTTLTSKRRRARILILVRLTAST